MSDPKVAMPGCKWQFLRLPRLTYPNVRCAPVLEITIFGTACRFLIQTLKRHLFFDRVIE